MNKLHTYIAESEAEWIEKFTTDNNLGQQVRLSHFLINDDGYDEPLAGGNTNEVHQHLKWLKAHNQAILERVVEMVEESRVTQENLDTATYSDGTPIERKEIKELVKHINYKTVDNLKAQLTESK